MPVTQGDLNDLRDVCTHLYGKQEIKDFRMDEAIQNHPLNKKNTILRSKYAVSEILKQLQPTTKYLLPGQVVLFGYKYPKFINELPYFDALPLVIFIGITRTKDNTIREIGFNLHYYPPYARMKILNTVYEVFKAYYAKYFNNAPPKHNQFINYNTLKAMLRNQKIAFGLRMYIPVLRGKSYIIPTRLLPTASFTEGRFNGATLTNIRSYWRRAKRK